MNPPVGTITVSEAAARLKVSERTVRRRCEKGKLLARLESTPSGLTWFIDVAAIPADAISNDGASIEAGMTAPSAVMLRTPAARAEDALITALLAEKDARIHDLKEQLQAANNALEREQQAHAETRRLFAFNLSVPSTPIPEVKPAETTTQTTPRIRKRHPRPFWAVLIGYRPKDEQ